MKNIKRIIMGIYLTSLLSLALMVLAGCEENNSNEDVPVNDSLPEISDYPIVGTNQTLFYSNSDEISVQNTGDDYYGQNANYPGNVPTYTDNGDGTITDEITGLMWQQSPDLNNDGLIDVNDKLSYNNALAGASSFSLAGYSDWRLPTIKELYSLILFSGEDISGLEGVSTEGLIPFIDDSYFEFGYGDASAGERLIDAQFATSTKYVDYTMNGNETMFGVNFADGRIKGYPLSMRDEDKLFYVLYVRGNQDYGKNSFVDNGDGTISDIATGLMWMTNDSEQGMNWDEALQYAEGMEFTGHSDWRLPDIKELQSIVDYTKAPATTGTPAIDSKFNCTEINNEAGAKDYPYYWSSTTHANNSPNSGGSACYVSFGRAMGYMFGEWIDVHGAGAQRSDPKTGDASSYPNGHGPQGDAIRIQNYVRCVRTID